MADRSGVCWSYADSPEQIVGSLSLGLGDTVAQKWCFNVVTEPFTRAFCTTTATTCDREAHVDFERWNIFDFKHRCLDTQRRGVIHFDFPVGAVDADRELGFLNSEWRPVWFSHVEITRCVDVHVAGRFDLEGDPLRFRDRDRRPTGRQEVADRFPEDLPGRSSEDVADRIGDFTRDRTSGFARSAAAGLNEEVTDSAPNEAAVVHCLSDISDSLPDVALDFELFSGELPAECCLLRAHFAVALDCVDGRGQREVAPTDAPAVDTSCRRATGSDRDIEVTDRILDDVAGVPKACAIDVDGERRACTEFLVFSH
ncbi:hypothetical protein DEQ92_20215 [Haloferax sp. Atlit-6N]|nr:hypothetical protein DEQ92_20215 [Haloferax sp. Atlit-6N]